jgi:hypothetical protein
MDATQAITAIRALSPDAIRQRLDELDAERKALLTLLRASQHAARGGDRRKAAEGSR